MREYLLIIITIVFFADDGLITGRLLDELYDRDDEKYQIDDDQDDSDAPKMKKDIEVFPAEYYQSDRGNYLCVDGYYFLKNTVSHNTMSWRCTLYRSFKCKARAKTDFSRPNVAQVPMPHHTHNQSDHRSIKRQPLVRKMLKSNKDRRPEDPPNPVFI